MAKTLESITNLAIDSVKNLSEQIIVFKFPVSNFLKLFMGFLFLPLNLSESFDDAVSLNIQTLFNLLIYFDFSQSEQSYYQILSFICQRINPSRPKISIPLLLNISKLHRKLPTFVYEIVIQVLSKFPVQLIQQYLNPQFNALIGAFVTSFEVYKPDSGAALSTFSLLTFAVKNSVASFPFFSAAARLGFDFLQEILRTFQSDIFSKFSHNITFLPCTLR